MRSLVLFALTLAATAALTSDASALCKRKRAQHCDPCATAVMAAPMTSSCGGCGGGGGYYGGGYGGYHGPMYGGYGYNGPAYGGYGAPVYGGAYAMPQPGVGAGGAVVVPGPMPGK